MTTPVIGPPEYAQADHDDCGTLAGNAWVQAFRPGAPGLPVLDSSWGTQIAAAINVLKVGLTALAEQPEDVNAYLATYLPQGDGIMVPVRVQSWDCTVNPNASPYAEHWVDVYAVDAAGVHIYNCWPAAYQQVDPTTFQAAYALRSDIQCVRIIEDITMDSKTAFGLARMALPIVLGRGPNPDEVNGMAADIANSDLDSAINKWAARAQSGGEISLTERVVHLKMDGNSGAPQHTHASTSAPSGPVQPHTHALPSGSTGPAQ